MQKMCISNSQIGRPYLTRWRAIVNTPSLPHLLSPRMMVVARTTTSSITKSEEHNFRSRYTAQDIGRRHSLMNRWSL
ncbi:hypothetical protein LINPERHAP1_LOCUS20750 [Linum perenne]